MTRKNSPSRSTRKSRSTLNVAAVIVAIIALLYTFLNSRLESFYIFNPESLHDLSIRAISTHGNDTRAIISFITHELSNNFPGGYINLNEEWIFNNAGGAMGAMYVIHASTTVGTEGHTGRHTADDYFNILTGTQIAFNPGSFEPEIYPPGSVHHLPRGAAKQYKMESSCFALEYARGLIPPMLFFGFADGLTSTLDFPTLWRTTWVTGRETIKNLARFKL